MEIDNLDPTEVIPPKPDYIMYTESGSRRHVVHGVSVYKLRCNYPLPGEKAFYRYIFSNKPADYVLCTIAQVLDPDHTPNRRRILRGELKEEDFAKYDILHLETFIPERFIYNPMYDRINIYNPATRICYYSLARLDNMKPANRDQDV